MFSLVLIFFPQQMVLSSNVSKKKNQFLFRLGVNAMKQLWCNADTQMFRAFSSIKANLDSKKFCFIFYYCNYCSSIQRKCLHKPRRLAVRIKTAQFLFLFATR